MSVNTPPTEDIPIFDPSVFPSANGSALTIASGSKYFLTYPVAQGSEIFPSNITLQSTLTDGTGAVGTAGQFLTSTVTGTEWSNFAVAGDFDIPPPYKLLTDTITESASHVGGTDINLYGTTTDDDILIGSTLGSGHTLRLCNTTLGTSGGSVHCCNVGFDASNINNATAPASGLLKLANSQTTGALYIGGGSATATRTDGPIIIGSDSTATGGINIGTGTNLTVPTTNTINIGQTSYTTNVNGALTTTGLLTANGDITSPTITSTTKFKGIAYDAPGSSYTLSLGETLTNGATSAVVPLMLGININGTPTTGIQLGNSATKIKLEGATTALSLATTSGSISSGGIITGTSVVSSSFNASGDSTTVGISTTQTTGALNIGTAGGRTGAGLINIGGGSGAASSINIGQVGTTTGTTTVNIGTSTVGIHPVNIGSSTSNTNIGGDIVIATGATITSGGLLVSAGGIEVTNTGIDINAGGLRIASGGATISTGGLTINGGGLGVTAGNLTTATGNISTTSGNISTTTGTITAGGGLILGSTKGITLSTGSYTPTSTQLGYSASATNAAQVNIASSSSGTILTTGSVIDIGVYIVSYNITVVMNPATTAAYMAFSFTLSAGITLVGNPTTNTLVLVGSTNSNGNSTFTYTTIARATSNNQSIAIVGTNSSGVNSSIKIGEANVVYIKIA